MILNLMRWLGFVLLWAVMTACSNSVLTIEPSCEIDSLVVEKSKRHLTIYSDGLVVKTYEVSLGRNPIGAKRFEGDKKTPEGFYVISRKNAKSSFHANLEISYPNSNDIDFANKAGKSAGGYIQIHGLKTGFGWLGRLHLLIDWTAGCIALTNPEIEELYNFVPVGTVIEIKP